MVRVLPALTLVVVLVPGALAAVPTLDPVPETVVPPAPTPAVPTTPVPALPPRDLERIPVASEAGAAAQPPFTGTILADGAQVRGGASANHYPLLRLAKGAEVQVLGRSFGWYRIAAPEGVFCWIHANYVQVDADGKAGTVSGDNVNVRGDSVLGHEPMKSDVVDQVSRGTRVTVVGREGEFLRIAPTPGARVYVSADLVSPKGGLAPSAAAAAGGTTTRPAPSVASAVLDQAEDALAAEQAKQPRDWDLDRVATLYRGLLEQTTSSRVRALVEARLKHIDQLRQVKETLTTVERNREATEKALRDIEAQYAARVAPPVAPAAEKGFAAVGIVKLLDIGDKKMRFKLVDDDDAKRILCVLEGDAATLEAHLNHRVGLMGNFRLTSEWPVKVLNVTSVERLDLGSRTRLALPPAPTENGGN